MAFGDLYGYRTNSRFVVASAESAERTRTVGGEEVTVVDLVLHGFAPGRRNNVIVNKDASPAWGDIRVNTCVPKDVADALTGADSVAPGETTASHVVTGYRGGADTPVTE